MSLTKRGLFAHFDCGSDCEEPMTTDEEYERLRASVGPIVEVQRGACSDPCESCDRVERAAMRVVAQARAEALSEVNSTCPEDRQEVLDTTLAAAEALVAQVKAKGEQG